MAAALDFCSDPSRWHKSAIVRIVPLFKSEKIALSCIIFSWNCIENKVFYESTWVDFDSCYDAVGFSARIWADAVNFDWKTEF